MDSYTEFEHLDIKVEEDPQLLSEVKTELQVMVDEEEHIDTTNTPSGTVLPDVTLMFEQNKLIGKRSDPKVKLNDTCGERQNPNNCSAELQSDCSNEGIMENSIASNSASNTISRGNIEQSVFFENTNMLKTFSMTNKAIRRPKYNECDICGKSVRNLIPHKKMHTGEKPHQCILCGHRFIQKSNLNKHLLVHTGERPHTCNQCGKTYVCISDLNQHRKLHIGTAFTCTFCEKMFTSRQNLECHERIHTGEKPFLCQTCGKCFSIKGSLINHSKRVHANDLKHCCSICNKRFLYRSLLNRHFRTHTGEKSFTCDICHNSFSDRGCFIRHLDVHSGEKSYSCLACNKRFTQLISLKRHVRLHTGEKPFRCTLCNECFVLKRDLKKHNERFHSASIQ